MGFLAIGGIGLVFLMAFMGGKKKGAPDAGQLPPGVTPSAPPAIDMARTPDQVRNGQHAINALLASVGRAQIKVDGKVGPLTCAAQNFVLRIDPSFVPFIDCTGIAPGPEPAIIPGGIGDVPGAASDAAAAAAAAAASSVGAPTFEEALRAERFALEREIAAFGRQCPQVVPGIDESIAIAMAEPARGVFETRAQETGNPTQALFEAVDFLNAVCPSWQSPGSV